MQRQQAHEMQGVGVIRIYLKRLPAAELGVEVPPGAEMMKASFTESSRCARRQGLPGRSRVFARILGGYPALAAVHQRVFRF